MYWSAAHVGAFYNRSTYTLVAIVPRGHSTWPGYIFLQHYSPPGLEFDFDLGRARKLLSSWAIHFEFLKMVFGPRRSSCAKFSLGKVAYFQGGYDRPYQTFWQSSLIEHG